MLLLNSNDIQKTVIIPKVIEALREKLPKCQKNNSIVPLRTIIPIDKEDALALCMPAYSNNLNEIGVKIATIYPRNNKSNLPIIHAQIILFDSNNGSVKAIIDGQTITALKTGAMTGLATDLCAPPTAQSVAIIGSGTQARSQLSGVICVRNIKQVFLYSRNTVTVQKFSEEIIHNHKNIKEVYICSNAHEATILADIICLATSKSDAIPIINDGDVKENVHINSIGGTSNEACEFDPHMLGDQEVFIVVDDKKSALKEAGEIRFALKNNIIDKKNINEIKSLISKNYNYQYKLSIFKSVGNAIQDLIVANLVFSLANRKKIGKKLDYL